MTIIEFPTGKLLLVGDDSVFSRRLTERLALLEGVEILGPARNAREALRLLEQHAPHGLVLDLKKTELDGLEMLATVRERDRACIVVVLALQKDTAPWQNYLECGADHFIDKSAELERIVGIVRELARDFHDERSDK